MPLLLQVVLLELLLLLSTFVLLVVLQEVLLIGVTSCMGVLQVVSLELLLVLLTCVLRVLLPDILLIVSITKHRIHTVTIMRILSLITCNATTSKDNTHTTNTIHPTTIINSVQTSIIVRIVILR